MSSTFLLDPIQGNIFSQINFAILSLRDRMWGFLNGWRITRSNYRGNPYRWLRLQCLIE